MTEVTNEGGYPVEVPAGQSRELPGARVLPPPPPAPKKFEPAKNPHHPYDTRSVVTLVERDWASEDTKAKLEALVPLRETYDAEVSTFDTETDKIRRQDLLDATVPDPLHRWKGRLRIARAYLAFHEAALVYAEAIHQEAESRLRDRSEGFKEIVDELRQSLLDLGFPESALGTGQIPYGRNARFVEWTNRKESARNDEVSLKTCVEGCRVRIVGARTEIAHVEWEIRNALNA